MTDTTALTQKLRWILDLSCIITLCFIFLFNIWYLPLTYTPNASPPSYVNRVHSNTTRPLTNVFNSSSALSRAWDLAFLLNYREANKTMGAQPQSSPISSWTMSFNTSLLRSYLRLERCMSLHISIWFVCAKTYIEGCTHSIYICT
jgi:hypothetical protein